MILRAALVAVFVGGCSGDDAWKGYDFELETRCEGRETSTGTYFWGDHRTRTPCASLLGPRSCRTETAPPDEPNPDVVGLAGGAEDGVFAVRVVLVDQEGPECVLTKSNSSDTCDRDGVPCLVRMTPL